MERFIAGLVKDFESGKMDRREFCQTVALAAAVYGAGDAANAQASRGFKMIGINHISYACPDYAKARDFYTSVFGMESTPGKDNGKRANLMFGPEPGKGGSFIVARTAPTDAKPSRAVVDHVCYTIANWDDQKVRAALKAKGLEVGGREGSLHRPHLPAGCRLVLQSLQPRSDRRPRQGRGAAVRQEGRAALQRRRQGCAADPPHLPHPRSQSGAGGGRGAAAEGAGGDRPRRLHGGGFRPRKGKGGTQV